MRLFLVFFMVGCAVPLVPDEEPTPEFAKAVHPLVNEVAGYRCSSVQVAPEVALTARHCLPMNEGELFQGAKPVLAYEGHEILDLAWLVTAPDPGPYAKLGTRPVAGELISIVGYGCDRPPMGHTRRRDVRAGAYLGAGPNPGAASDLWFTGVVCGGDSGGGLFNQYGDLVGVLWGSVQEPVPGGAASPAEGYLGW